MTRRERARVGALLKAEYGPLVTVEVQEPCKALWITIEGPNGDWTASVDHANSPILPFLVPDFPSPARPQSRAHGHVRQ